MPHRNHVAIWIDHLQARVFQIGLTEVSSEVIHSHLPTQHLHHKANTIGSGHIADDPEFLAKVDASIKGAEQILILGPSTEKVALRNYLDAQIAASDRLISVASSDHLTDNEIVAFARKHFRMNPTRSTL